MPKGADLQTLLKAAQQMSETAQETGGWEEDAYYGDQAAVRQLDHSIKVLAPVMLSVSGFVDVQQEPDKLDSLLDATLKKAVRDADTMLSAIDMPPDTAPSWLVQHLRGVLVEEIASGLSRNNAHATREDTDYLMPLIDHLAQAQESGTMSEHNLPFASSGATQVDATLARASSAVLMEYQRFNYFHTVSHKISDMVRDTIQERVIGGTLSNLTHDFQLNDAERTIIGGTLVRQAGAIMAASWGSNTGHVRDMLAEMETSDAVEARKNGMPLDFVVNEFESQYSAAELAMYSALESMIPEQMTQPGETAKARMGDVAAEAQRMRTAPEGIDSAIRSVSHGVKVLAPILMAASREMGERKQSAALNELIQGTMTKAAGDSTQMLERSGISQGEAPIWLVSHVRGVLTQAIASSVAKDGGYQKEDGDDHYVEVLLKYGETTKGIAAPSYDHQPVVSHNLKMGDALAQATSKVMNEYQQFGYFHPNPSNVAYMVANKLRDTAYDGTLQRTKATFNLSRGESDYLGVTLVHHAGEMMANAWASNIEPCNEEMALMQPAELRSVRANGMPLDSIFDEFDSQYSGVEISIQSGLKHMMGERMVAQATDTPTEKKNTTPGMR